jgi:hypothetical protein
MSKNNDQVFDAAAIEQLQKDYESAIENWDGKIEVLPTRASVKRQFVNLDIDTMVEVQEAIDNLDDQLGFTDTHIRHLSQFEIDTLVEELLAVRKVNDILSSREETLKTFAKDIISLDQIEPDRTSGELVSQKHKLKISKEIRGGKLTIDIDRLKKRLTGDQFSSVTNVITTTVETTTPDGKMDEVITTTYEVNEKFLEAEMVKGNILSEDVFLSSVESKRTSAIYIRDLEN